MMTKSVCFIFFFFVILFFFFFFNDTPTTEIYTLSLHDALPIWAGSPLLGRDRPICSQAARISTRHRCADFRPLHRSTQQGQLHFLGVFGEGTLKRPKVRAPWLRLGRATFCDRSPIAN